MVDHKELVEETDDEGVDRRGFVKGCLGVAAVGALGAAGFGMFKQVAVVKETGARLIEYFGAKVIIGSPAPRGVPVIPVTLAEDGDTILGVPDRLDWYRYCSHENAPGLANEAFTDDNRLYVNYSTDKLHQASQSVIEGWWYLDLKDQPLKLSHFRDLPVDSGAPFRWRSEGQRGNDIITGIIIKLDADRLKAAGQDVEEFAIQHESLGDGILVAYSSYCTHFCCVPGYKEDETAKEFDQGRAWDMMFCTCHNSRYNPYELEDYEFTLVLAEDAGGGGGGGGH